MISDIRKIGKMKHVTTKDKRNVLLQGQKVISIDEDRTTLRPLRPSEMTFHHGWTRHASMPNISSDRRIELNVQYLATYVKQKKHDQDSAILMRGEDAYQHFKKKIPATLDVDPEAMQLSVELEHMYLKPLEVNNDIRPTNRLISGTVGSTPVKCCSHVE